MPSKPVRPVKADVVKKLGARFVTPEKVVPEEGQDRFEAIAKAQKAAKAANAGKVVAGSSVPSTWTLPAAAMPEPSPQPVVPAKKAAAVVEAPAAKPKRRGTPKDALAKLKGKRR